MATRSSGVADASAASRRRRAESACAFSASSYSGKVQAFIKPAPNALPAPPHGQAAYNLMLGQRLHDWHTHDGIQVTKWPRYFSAPHALYKAGTCCACLTPEQIASCFSAARHKLLLFYYAPACISMLGHAAPAPSLPAIRLFQCSAPPLSMPMRAGGLTSCPRLHSARCASFSASNAARASSPGFLSGWTRTDRRRYVLDTSEAGTAQDRRPKTSISGGGSCSSLCLCTS